MLWSWKVRYTEDVGCDIDIKVQTKRCPVIIHVTVRKDVDIRPFSGTVVRLILGGGSRRRRERVGPLCHVYTITVDVTRHCRRHGSRLFEMDLISCPRKGLRKPVFGRRRPPRGAHAAQQLDDDCVVLPCRGERRWVLRWWCRDVVPEYEEAVYDRVDGEWP